MILCLSRPHSYYISRVLGWFSWNTSTEASQIFHVLGRAAGSHWHLLRMRTLKKRQSAPLPSPPYAWLIYPSKMSFTSNITKLFLGNTPNDLRILEVSISVFQYLGRTSNILNCLSRVVPHIEAKMGILSMDTCTVMLPLLFW